MVTRPKVTGRRRSPGGGQADEPPRQGRMGRTAQRPNRRVPPPSLSREMTRQTRTGEMSAGEASDLLYPFLFDGTVHDRRSVFATLRKVATPRSDSGDGLRTYRLQGYEGYLNEAASLLASFGAAAWPAIRKVGSARGGRVREPGGDRLLSVQGLPDAERLAGLKDLVSKGDHNTRSRASGRLTCSPGRFRKTC